MSNERVSVIIPTYQRSVPYIKRAVESVLAQTHSDIEVIVIDDSPDSYPERARVAEYMRGIESSNVVYLQNERNMGGSLSRNRGIDAATGAYITFLDDDDKYLPEKVEQQLAFMRRGDYDMTFTDMVMYDQNGKIVDYRSYDDLADFDHDSLLRYHLTRHLTGTPTFMFKADKLREIGGFDDAKMGQEFYLMYKCIEHHLKIGHLDECGVCVYKHADGGVSQGMNRIRGEKALHQFKKRQFHRLSRRDRAFIRFRHFAIMAVAYARNGMFPRAAGAGIAAFCVSPLDFAQQVCAFLKKIFKRRKEAGTA